MLGNWFKIDALNLEQLKKQLISFIKAVTPDCANEDSLGCKIVAKLCISGFKKEQLGCSTV